MRILYLGDIMGPAGITAVERWLDDLKREENVDVVIAQAENVTDGRGMSHVDFQHLREIGIDFCTGGNWSMYRSDLIADLNDPNSPVIRPANYPSDVPGRGWKILKTIHGDIAVISLLGHIVGKDADKPVDNALQTIDKILQELKDYQLSAVVVNFHGDYSSEKRIIGYYLDGKASIVVGDHWHVPTADAMVLPNGTAHMTDVGMCGSLHSSLGVKLSSTIPRWRDGVQTRNELETDGPLQLNALLVDLDGTGHATSARHIQKIG